MKPFYFAYGSNMDEGQMAQRCPDARAKDVVQLLGFEFFLDTRGVASIRTKQGKSVWGMRYEISDADERALDKWEGVPTYYTKSRHPQIESFCYVSTSPQGDAPREGYMEKIIKAAKVHKLPEEYISELRSWLKRNG